MALTKTTMGLAEPDDGPALERLIDGFWGVDDFIDAIRNRIETELRNGKYPFVKVYINDRNE